MGTAAVGPVDYAEAAGELKIKQLREKQGCKGDQVRQKRIHWINLNQETEIFSGCFLSKLGGADSAAEMTPAGTSSLRSRTTGRRTSSGAAPIMPRASTPTELGKVTERAMMSIRSS